MEKANLNPNQLRAISCILESSSIEEAAKKAKISRGTIYLWLKDQTFKARLEKERDILFYEHLNLLRQAAGKATKVLIDLLKSEDETTRRLAAREILSQSLRITEIRSLERRISWLEEVVEQKYQKL